MKKLNVETQKTICAYEITKLDVQATKLYQQGFQPLGPPIIFQNLITQTLIKIK